MLCLLHEGILSAYHLSGNKCLLSRPGSSWCHRSLKRAATAAAAAAVQAPTSLDAVNIYPPTIIAAPGGLRAPACWVNRGRRWEINEQCASGCGWEEPLMGRVLLKAMTCTCGKGHPGLWQAPRCHLHVTAESRHPPLSSAHRLNPQGQQPGYSDLLPDFALLLLSEQLVFYMLCVDALTACYYNLKHIFILQ